LSEKATPWSELASGLFTILTVVTTYLGTQPFTTLFAVLLGAFVTYAVQKRLQKGSEKRSRNAEYIEKFYGPLLVEIQKIQDTVLTSVSGSYNFENLKSFKMLPQFYTMGKKLRADFLSFSDEIRKLAQKISFYKNRIIDLIHEKGQAYLTDTFGKTYGKRVTFVSDHSYSPISLRYELESEWFRTSLETCILQDKSPINIIKDKVSNFQVDNLKVEIYYTVDEGKGGYSSYYDTRSYSERKEILDKILSEVKSELNKDQAYNDFRTELNDLRKKADSISSRLAKYIETHVSTVDI